MQPRKFKSTFAQSTNPLLDDPHAATPHLGPPWSGLPGPLSAGGSNNTLPLPDSEPREDLAVPGRPKPPALLGLREGLPVPELLLGGAEARGLAPTPPLGVTEPRGLMPVLGAGETRGLMPVLLLGGANARGLTPTPPLGAGETRGLVMVRGAGSEERGAMEVAGSVLSPESGLGICTADPCTGAGAAEWV
jgi:hypothetical protein